DRHAWPGFERLPHRDGQQSRRNWPSWRSRAWHTPRSRKCAADERRRRCAAASVSWKLHTPLATAGPVASCAYAEVPPQVARYIDSALPPYGHATVWRFPDLLAKAIQV